MARALLIDTNHLGVAIRPYSPFRRRFEEARRDGLRVGCCIPVLCELESAFRPPERQVAFRKALHRFFQRVPLWPLDMETARLYGEAFRELREKGRVFSQVDMILVAMARQMNLTILTADKDFAALPDVRTENWLA